MNQDHNKSKENTYDLYISSLLIGNRLNCGMTIKNLLHANSNTNALSHEIINIYEQFFQRSLYAIGEYWEKNLITVATEHMATAITEGIMNEVYPLIINPKRISKKVIVSSVENEEHQIGAKMVSDMFEMHGWDAIYLGANTPLNELILFIEQFKPNLLALSLSVYFNLPNLESMLNKITDNYPDVPIIIGGQAFRYGGKDIADLYSNVIYISDLNSLEKYILTLDQ
ncbi:MAG: cobalamin-dependent protein [Desulfobacterales bacterium]|nr:cobalamin-dependent protein [Desulfobacterales bacterium]